MNVSNAKRNIPKDNFGFIHNMSYQAVLRIVFQEESMPIEHVAMFVNDLEKTKDFFIF